MPVSDSKLLPAPTQFKPPLLREHRLYQADWLLRFYHFRAEEILEEDQPDFDPRVDPKCSWALRHMEQFPVEVSAADYETLLRVPGIGVTSARRILVARRAAPLTFDVLKKHPRLAVTFAHFLFLSDRPEILESIFDHYENVSIDVTPGTEMYVNFSGDLPFYRAFFEKHADRILFGTDATVPIRADAEERIHSVYRAMVTGDTVLMGRARRPVQGLALPPDVADRVLRENFLQRWGKAPKPINRNALKAYIEKYAHMISHGETKKQILLAAKSLV